jgi:hypothetical protein
MSRWARPASQRPADDPQPLVDQVVVDVDIADLAPAVEELGHEQVLALRGDLDDPVRRRHRQAGVPHQAAAGSPRTAPAGAPC